MKQQLGTIKVHSKMIGTGGFLRITSEIGIESQQTWYRSTSWLEWNITVPTITRSDLMLVLGPHHENSTFYRNRKIIKNSEQG